MRKDGGRRELRQMVYRMVVILRNIYLPPGFSGHSSSGLKPSFSAMAALMRFDLSLPEITRETVGTATLSSFAMSLIFMPRATRRAFMKFFWLVETNFLGFMGRGYCNILHLSRKKVRNFAGSYHAW